MKETGQKYVGVSDVFLSGLIRIQVIPSRMRIPVQSVLRLLLLRL